MLDYLKRHHVGVIALFVALGGTSYAATQLPRNSVGTGQIRAGAVTATKIHNGAITSAKLSPGLIAQLRGTKPPANTAWRDPAISTSISSAGQTIVSQKIITVEVTAPWVNTGLSIATGQHLWADTRSDGRWTGNPQFFPYSDANGLGPSVYQSCWQVDTKAPVESLIGFIGSSPPNAPEGCRGGITDPGFVEVGNTLMNFAPKTTGTIWLRTNDNTNHISNVGQQIVKVIVTTP
ncbi:MAG TPA: hypothetical protein VGY76_03250 [Solirubrobacteraceae bacterium]|jgi:hypothetical protein|nr:hypothetical protein [Solirubrobacteraceae bacterium]